MMPWKPATPLVPRSAAGYRLSALRAWTADTNAIRVLFSSPLESEIYFEKRSKHYVPNCSRLEDLPSMAYAEMKRMKQQEKEVCGKASRRDERW